MVGDVFTRGRGSVKFKASIWWDNLLVLESVIETCYEVVLSESYDKVKSDGTREMAWCVLAHCTKIIVQISKKNHMKFHVM